MPFTIDDFPDLLRLLDQHPEWRAELRRHVLGDELPELPALARQLIEAQTRTEARVDALAEAQARTAEQLSVLTAHVGSLTDRVDGLSDRVDTMGNRVGDLSGKMLEIRYRDRAGAYFNPLAGRVRVLDPGRLADRLDDAVEAGQLTTGERATVLQTDLVLTGSRRDDRAEVYLVVEVSVGIGSHDVERAVQRAQLLAKLGRPVVPVVAGEWIIAETAAQARAAGVWQVLDGHAVPPTDPPGA
jgi:hypothetical protein